MPPTARFHVSLNRRSGAAWVDVTCAEFRDEVAAGTRAADFGQINTQLAGDSALTAPAPTLAHLWEMVWQPRFLPHLRETALAFAQALLIACVGGVAIGVLLGGHRLSGEVAVALTRRPPLALAYHGVAPVPRRQDPQPRRHRFTDALGAARDERPESFEFEIVAHQRLPVWLPR